MRHDVGLCPLLMESLAGSRLGRGSQGAICNSESSLRGREQNLQSKLGGPEAEAPNVEKFGGKEQERTEQLFKNLGNG